MQRMPRFALWMVLALGAVGLLCPNAAVAQEANEEESDEAKARQHFEAGAQHFYRKAYTKAVVEFLKAYEYQPDAMILYNLSMAHGRLGNLDEAKAAASKARRMGGMPEKAALRNDARIVAWDRALAARKMASSAAPRAEKESDGGAGPDDASAAGARPESSQGLGAVGYSGIAMATIGVGLLAYAGYVDRAMADDLEAYRQAGEQGDQQNYERHRSELDRQQTIGRITLYAGAATAVAGAALLLFDLYDDDGVEVEAGATSAGDGLGARLRFRFD